MSTTVTVLGGVGLFLLGMSVMTSGLKALAGSGLRTTLRKAAATPLSGAFWGAFVTLIVQSSSATTMTTIGLVSAGLLTFPQGLALVFGANIGTTGTAWLIALIGVRVSLTAAALPMIFVGALVKLLGPGRISAAGASLAGFALVLFGLTTLQQGMSGVAELLQPADLPAVYGDGANWWSTLWGVLSLVALGLAMTAVMQSSTAAVAVTLSAHFAGAIGLDQACALIIGQNIGTATSSAMAAIGASSTAKRLAVAYILFKLVAAVIALAVFPFTYPLMLLAAQQVDGVTLLAAYHTAYNVVGVTVLLPVIDRFTRIVERILPERRSQLTACLDKAALLTPVATEEAVRRTVARALATMCEAIVATVTGLRQGSAASAKTSASLASAVDALREAREFMAEASGPPESGDEEMRLTRTLLALDEASRLAEASADRGEVATVAEAPDDARAMELCVRALREAALLGNGIGALPDSAAAAAAAADDISSEQHLARLKDCAKTLRELQRAHRQRTLASVAGAGLSADAAMTRVDSVRRLEILARRAWRCASHLADRAPAAGEAA